MRRGGSQALTLLACAALILAQRLPYARVPLLNVDEAIWVVGGEWMRAGGIPYRDFQDNRPPGMYALYGLAVRATPWSAAAARYALDAFHMLTCAALCFAGSTAGSTWGGAMASLLFALSCSAYAPADFQSAESEGFMATFAAWGFAATISSIASGRARRGIAAGLAAFAAIAMKQPAAIEAAAVAMALLALAARRAIPARLAARTLLAATTALVLAAAATSALFASRGALADLVYHCFTYPLSRYAPPSRSLLSFGAWREVATYQPLLLWGGLVSIPLLLFLPSHKSEEPWARGCVAAWAIGSLAASTYGSRTFPHYILELLPSHALALGLLLDRAARRFTRPGTARAAILAAAALAMAPATMAHVAHGYVAKPPMERFLGEEIGRETLPDDRLFVWGYLVESYFYSHRLPACGDITSQFISGFTPADGNRGAEARQVPHLRDRCLAEIRARPPAFILDYSAAGYRPLSTFPELERFRDERYQLSGRVPSLWWGGSGTLEIYRRSDLAMGPHRP